VNEAESSRREALRRGAIVAGGLAAAGALRPAFAVAQSTADDDLRDFLQQAIGLEQITVLAYSTAADSGDPKLKSAMEDFRDQEQAHASALRSALDELGFDPPDAPDSPSDGAVFDDVEGLDSDSSPYTAQDLKDLLSDLDGLKGAKEYLDYLVKLEEAQIGYYVGEAPGLDSVDLATTGAEIAGCQAEHLIVLHGELGDEPATALGAAISTIEGAASGSDSSGSSSQ
jgi:Ferritin-like domain